MSQNTMLPFAFDPMHYDLPSGGGNHKITKTGKHLFSIESAYMQPSKNNPANVMAVFEFLVTSGEAQGERMTEYLNIMHSIPDTKKYANQSLAAICTATGVTQLTDLAVFKGRQLQMNVIATHDEVDDNPNIKRWNNKITGFYNADGTDLVRGGAPNYGQQPQGQYAPQGQPQQGYAPQNPTPTAPAPTAPQQQPQGQYAPQNPAPQQQPQQQQYAQNPAPTAPQQPAPNFAPQQQQAPSQPAPNFAPQNGGQPMQPAPNFAPQQ